METGNCPFPTVSSQGKQDGYLLAQPNPCLDCPLDCAEYCREPALGLTIGTCPKGLSVAKTPLPGSPVVNGVVLRRLEAECPKHLRKPLKRHRVQLEAVAAWVRAQERAAVETEAHVANRVRESLQGLHDFKTGASLVIRCAERLVQEYGRGSGFEEKVQGSPPAVLSLFQAAQLLQDRLDMSDILLNPARARYGIRTARPVYKTVHRFVHMFQSQAHDANMDIQMNGHSVRSSLLYDSFDAIPLILIDNALKYGTAHRSVLVRVADTGGDEVDFEVSSFGPAPTSSEESSLFLRGFRGSNVEAKPGSGLGLYMARLVAEAHGTRVVYERPTGAQGWNRFSLRLRAC